MMINDPGGTTMNRLLLSIGCAVLVLWHAAGSATTLPEYYPKAFAQWGVVSQVDVAAGEMIVNDQTIRIARDANVYTPNTRHETVHGLRPGVRIAWGSGGARSPGAVTAIWVLPPNYTPSRTRR